MADSIEKAILEVYTKVGYVPKGGQVSGSSGGYRFAGEADIISSLRPAMVEAGITVRPIEVREIRREQYTTKSGTPMVNTVVHVRFAFAHAPSATLVEVEAAGEGSDAGDKSLPKALTIAYKYALRQTFLLATGDDPDKETHEERQKSSRGSRSDRQPPKPKAPEWWGDFLSAARSAGLTGRDIADFLSANYPLTWEPVQDWADRNAVHQVELVATVVKAKEEAGADADGAGPDGPD